MLAMTDNQWMQKALALAKKGWGKTSPNPMVGAILVRNGQEVGRGWHHRSGAAHAEILALEAAGRLSKSSTLYVTLEPCCTHGKTPPCTRAIGQAGINKVVIASLDPNPNHKGKGVALLKDAGIDVIVGIEKEKSQKLNEAFACWIRHRRPMVLLKMAMTMDGKIATKSGESKWITSNSSRNKVQKLRQWADAILVGGETVRNDNPQLLVRTPKNWHPQPIRLIISRSGNLGKSPHVLKDGQAETQVRSVQSAKEWNKLLLELGQLNVTSLLVEGGGEIAGTLLRHNLIDKVVLFIAPKILGGKNSRSVFAGPDPLSLNEAKTLKEMQFSKSGVDYQITGYLSNVHRMY